MKEDTKYHILMVSICLLFLSMFFIGMYLQYNYNNWITAIGFIMAGIGLSWFIFIATIYSISFR